ncbi:zinc-binding alcohol dehydrogenase family protein [Lacticaseibacillus hulanensis]|uniref:zinc-binding alcohol dehydrogenase family protein n=1 Tax=Lacticaseibacillus hulanensis TaxID=2493111 RepID=UPI000FDB1E59|nr:zinc-binding alcohol dehydrogenase family protein [Lacticaseibacillus hulanensis]
MTDNFGIGFYTGRPITDLDVFERVNLPMPEPRAHDLVVKVAAMAVNPIDTKLRQTAKTSSTPRILGFDAVGTVTALGEDTRGFHVGDRVLYAGSKNRQGSNKLYQAVDYRVVGHAPEKLSDADLAAIPLVGVTAWELLFEKMGFIPEAGANEGKTLLVINGAGGVGSMMTQLAKWSGLKVLATSSPKNFPWLRNHGVSCRIDYHDDIAREVHEQGYETIDGIAILFAPEPYLTLANKLVAPFGHVGCIVQPTSPLDVGELKNKAASLDFEFMFAKTDYHHNLAPQGEIIGKIANLQASGVLQSDVTQVMHGLTVDNLRVATAMVEDGHMQGKVVLTV